MAVTAGEHSIGSSEGLSLLGSERLRGHDELEQRSKRVLVLPGVLDGGLDLRLVGRSEFAAQTVREQFRGEAVQEQILFPKQRLAQIVHAVDGRAVGEFG